MTEPPSKRLRVARLIGERDAFKTTHAIMMEEWRKLGPQVGAIFTERATKRSTELAKETKRYADLRQNSAAKEGVRWPIVYNLPIARPS